ncbi:MAG: hypothetical protein RBU37_24135 [Myxococcota bacterium]|jgi:V/A-type H+-transporting ATPase subunit E|nr:hypothetical protein [Myxococcota bacterium]
MSSEGLEQVISELKTRGLKAAEKEGEEIIAKAKKEAQELVAKAKKEAEELLANAKSQAASTKSQMEAELRQASSVGLEAFRQAVQALFVVPEIDSKIRDVLSKPELLQPLMIEAVQAFSKAQGDELSVLLPASQQAELEKSMVKTLSSKLGKGVTVRFEHGFDFGFKLAPKGGGYLFDFSDEGFREIFMRFLAPRFRKHFLAES